jgi:hypothetical protein
MGKSSEGNGYWASRRVCVTGGAGFLGSYILEGLRQRGAREVFVPLIEEYDLVQQSDIVRAWIGRFRRSSTWRHVGGSAPTTHPAEFFYDNLAMGVQLIHESEARTRSSSPWGPSAPTPNSRRFRSAKKSCGTAIRRRPTRPTGSPRK